MLADSFQGGRTDLAAAEIIDFQWSEQPTQVVGGDAEVGVDILR